MLPATVFGFRLKRSIPLHLAWWYFYVNLPNITGNPENASHSKKKRSIRSSLANLLPQKDLTNLKILISYHSNHIISLSLYLNNIRREKIKSRSLQWILKLSLWWISFKMTPHLWWSSWYPFLWSQWAPPDDRDDHEALLMIRVIPPLMIKVVRTKEPPLCFVAGSPLPPPAPSWHCVSTTDQVVSTAEIYSRRTAPRKCCQRSWIVCAPTIWITVMGDWNWEKYWNSLRKWILFLREGAKGVGVISYLPYFLVSPRELSKKLSPLASISSGTVCPTNATTARESTAVRRLLSPPQHKI